MTRLRLYHAARHFCDSNRHFPNTASSHFPLSIVQTPFACGRLHVLRADALTRACRNRKICSVVALHGIKSDYTLLTASIKNVLLAAQP